MGIRAKLILLFAITLGLLSAVSVYSVILYQNILDEQKILADENNFYFQQLYDAESLYTKQISSWKNFLLRGEESDAYHKYLQEYYTRERVARSNFKKLKNNLGKTTPITPLADQLVAAHLLVGIEIRKALRVFNNSEVNAGQISDSYVAGVENKPKQLISEIILQLDEYQSNQLELLARERSNKQLFLIGTSIVVVICSLLVGFIIIHRNIVKPAEHSEYLASMVTDAENIAKFGTWDWDVTDEKNYWSQGLYRILGLDSEINESVDTFIAALHPEDRTNTELAIEQSINRISSFELEARVVTFKAPRIIQIRGKVSQKAKSGNIRLTCIVHDITQHKLSEEKLLKLANYDTLTGLPNRHLFQDRLEHALAQAKRNRTKLALLYLDLDQFKSVNDALGHYVGDELLKETALRLEGALRKSDTAARLGGDEFTVIIENQQTHNKLIGLVENLIYSLSLPYELNGQEAFVSASVGITVYPDDGEDVDTLLKNADAAMYLAKEKGKNTYYFYTKELNQQAAERLVLENGLRKALLLEQYQLYYQPQIELKTGKVVGAEALLRWLPDQNMVPPDRFIPILEDTGMIKEVGAWVFEEACRVAVQWREELSPDFRISVNLSVKQLHQPDLAGWMVAKLEEIKLDPTAVEIELTESMLIEESLRQDTLKDLEALGVRLAIDDFGTGYSSLSYLKSFSVDTLKIDRSFIKDITLDSDDDAVTSAIVALSHKLNMQVIAEGVESQSQLEFLKKISCDQAQGFFYARPMPRHRFEQWYKRYITELESDLSADNRG